MTRWAARLLAAAGVVLAASPVSAQAPATDPGFTYRTTIKASGLAARSPDDPLLFPDRNTLTGFLRARFEPTVRVGAATTVEVAYEHRARAYTAAEGLGTGGTLPPDTGGAYRIRPLDWTIASGANGSWRHEIDRAAVSTTVARTEITLGRQAIGWGRGVLFGAIDLFSPFTPLEVDREWRRGVDAARAEISITDRLSVGGVGVFGRDIDHSAFVARGRGYTERLDVEVVGGRRARDTFGGIASSAPIGDAELHGELAVFDTPGDVATPEEPDRHVVVKAVAGGSYRFGLGTGLLIFAEYHYSGFGAGSPDAIPVLLADPAFQERYLRGDTQILERHATAVIATYEWSPELSGSLQWIHSPADGSGILVPSATFTFGDRASLILNAYLPYGATPVETTVNSLYGLSPRAVFAQWRLHR